jgi:hypothetical protein
MTSLDPSNLIALITQDPSPLHPANKAAIFDALEAAGIAYVEVPFHGSGDEGFVGEPTAYLSTGTAETPQFTPIDLPTVMIGWSRLSDDGKETIIDLPLSNALDDAAWDCSYATSHSWEDHDGAEGTVTFLCGNRSIEVDMAQFYMESNHLLKTF